MFKKLDKILKEKYGGKKYLEVDSDLRNTDSDIRMAFREATDALATYLGADAMYLYAEMDEDDGTTIIQRGVRLGIERRLRILKEMLDDVDGVLPPNVMKAIMSYQGDSSEPGGMNIVELAGAMNIALKDLPPEYRKMVNDNMEKYLKGESSSSGKSKKGVDEDDLLADLLS